jgi:hypothetical protein
MLGFMLAHAGDAGGYGMLAFFPVGLLLLVGLILVLRPTVTSSSVENAEDEDSDDRPARDAGPEQEQERDRKPS